MDSNFDSYKISKKVMDLSLKNGVKFLPNTEVFKFEINKDKITNIVTNNGRLDFDKIIIACGIDTKEMLAKLSIKIPLMPIKGYSITVKIPPSNIPLKYNVCDDKSKVYVTRLGD